jgi:hypothetical protein
MIVKNFDRPVGIGNTKASFFNWLWLSMVLAHDVLSKQGIRRSE